MELTELTVEEMAEVVGGAGATADCCEDPASGCPPCVE
jgi:hypothetical protein